MSMFDLSGRTALVTGASGGIGLAIARGLADAGASVILAGRDEAKLHVAAQTLPGGPSTHRISVFDVADEAAVESAVTKLEDAGAGIDILVNNAGLQVRKQMLDLDLAEWRAVLDTNLTGAFVVGRAAVRGMIARGHGKIINITSLTGEITRPNVAPYTAAKGGLKMLTKSMAAEWTPLGIQVNALGPGNIATDMTHALQADERFDSWVRQRTPAGRWGRAEDLIGAAVFLASPASEFVSGQTLYVDGGLLSVM